MTSIDALLSRFPKKRPLLDPAIQAIYNQYYKDNREGKTFASNQARKIERWLHKKVANLSNPTDKKVLEIGAGNLNHIPFEPTIDIYDVVESMHHLYADSNYLNRVNEFYDDVSVIEKKHFYDRIISITVFEHILNLPFVISKAIQLLKPEGNLTVAIPSEGYFLWGLSWRITTGLEFALRYRLNYGKLMQYEHINTAKEIILLLKHAFQDIKLYRFGFLNHFSLFQVIDCRSPFLNRTEQWLKGMHE